MAAVKSIASDAKGRWLATASYDKTLRIWDVSTQSLMKIIRVPMASGNEGRLETCALSPDGRLVATGGFTGYWDKTACVYLFDRSSGDMVLRLAGFPDNVECIKFSADGKRLALCLWKGGIRVFDLPSGAEAFRDDTYGDQSYGLDFDLAGRLVTSCWDGHIRLYDPDGKKIADVTPRGGSQPCRVQFSPDGTRVAVGFGDAASVTVLAATDLSYLYTPNTSGFRGSLGRIAWSRDGHELMTGGWKPNTERDRYVIRIWSEGGKASYRDFVTPFADTILELCPMPDGRIGIADYSGWNLASPGSDGWVSTNATGDFRDRLLSVDASGKTLAFALDYPKGEPWRFELPARLVKTASPDLHPVRTEAPGVKVLHWRNEVNPYCNGQKLELSNGEISRQIAFQPDNQGFLLGADWNLYSFGKEGQLRWKRRIPAGCWTVNVSGDGTLGIAACADGVIRWFRMSDGQPLLLFYVQPGTQKWVAWTPSGYYDCSPGAEDLIGWHTNMGRDHAADFIPASKLRDKYHRPAIIDAVLGMKDEAQAIQKGK